MRREVVLDFLNLPGIAGVALMDGRSRPYFCGVDQALNFQQKEALAQGIQQVVETTPSGFEFFEFQFTGHQVYIYKLEHDIILLVLTVSELVHQPYSEAVEQLKSELKADSSNAIATFRLLAGNFTLSNQSYWAGRSTISASGSTAASIGTSNGSTTAAVPPPPAVPPQEASSPVVPPAAAPQSVHFKEVLTALNSFSHFTTQYLGTTVITNYWKTTRPEVEWLNNFQVDRSAQFSFSGSPPQSLTAQQHQWIQDWVTAFIQRCSKVIRDFPSTVEHRALDDAQKRLLLPPKP